MTYIINDGGEEGEEGVGRDSSVGYNVVIFDPKFPRKRKLFAVILKINLSLIFHFSANKASLKIQIVPPFDTRKGPIGQPCLVNADMIPREAPCCEGVSAWLS